jgi:dihydroneopterin aldolase
MTIHIENLEVNAIMGILAKERVTPQKIVINLKLDYENKEGAFINYVTLVQMIEKSIETSKFELIEDALLALHVELKTRFPQISSTKLKISKPNILDQCVVCVSLERKY